MQVYLDQSPAADPFNLDLAAVAEEITGIEVYAGSRRSRRSSTDSIGVAASSGLDARRRVTHADANERTFRRRRDPIALLR